MTQASYAIFNLKFRPHSSRFVLGGWQIQRVAEYDRRQAKLSCSVTSVGSEFSTSPRTGENVHTADAFWIGDGTPRDSLIYPISEEPGSLHDIMLLLRLFTGRDVTPVPWDVNKSTEPFVLYSDQRQYVFGGVLRTSPPYIKGELVDGDPLKWTDASLETAISKILATVSRVEWREKLGNGAFLNLLDQALKQRTIESAFTQCWTLWEHLFRCINRKQSATEKQKRTPAFEQIAFLIEFFQVLPSVSSKDKEAIKEIVKVRNELVHWGQFPDAPGSIPTARFFVELTEYICAIALELPPSQVFDTMKNLQSFLDQRTTFYHSQYED